MNVVSHLDSLLTQSVRILITLCGYSLYIHSVVNQLVPSLPATSASEWNLVVRLSVILALGVLGSAASVVSIATDAQQSGPAAGIAVIFGVTASLALPTGLTFLCGMEGTVGACLVILPIILYGILLWGRACASD
eukprot:PhF_6_TR6954/c2_g1_i1/m.10226